MKEDNYIIARYVVLVKATLASPMLIGSGSDDKQNMDVLLDYNGEPFIPGSSIAGVLRNYVRQAYEEKEVENNLFGESFESDKNLRSQSRIYVYDARIEKACLGVRNGIRVDEKKTTQENALYTMEVVEPGACVQLRMEYVQRKNDLGGSLIDIILAACKAIAQAELTFGAKHNRGFGKLDVQKVCCKSFDMCKREDVNLWLNWDDQGNNAFTSQDHVDLEKIKYTSIDHCLRVPLKLEGSLMIKGPYGSQRNTQNTLYEETLLLKLSEHLKVAVIPGSTWVGAIRGRVASTLQQVLESTDWKTCQNRLETMFGSYDANEENDFISSRIRMEESRMSSSGHLLATTRNRMDRFTGGCINGALFSDHIWVGGETELVIRWPRKSTYDPYIRGCLAWAISDIQAGLLAIGGQTAVGRGIFSSNGHITLDGEPFDKFFDTCKDTIAWFSKETII